MAKTLELCYCEMMFFLFSFFIFEFVVRAGVVKWLKLSAAVEWKSEMWEAAAWFIAVGNAEFVACANTQSSGFMVLVRKTV